MTSNVLDQIKNYCENAKKIQQYVLIYFNDTNEANNQNNLAQLFQEIDLHHISENDELFDQFLRMLANITSNCCHINNFYRKLFLIIHKYENIIKSNYSNDEIFSIFLHNEPVLLFLLKEQVFQFDKDIKYLINNGDHQEQHEYFFPTEQFDDKDQEEGQNHTQICKIIRSDSLQEFIKYTEKNDVQPTSIISPSPFETNDFLKNHKETTTILQYSAFYGSIKIFKYMIEKHHDILHENLWEFAFLGQNKEIIEILTNSKVDPPGDNFHACMINSIKCHQNELFEMLQKKFASNDKKDNEDNNNDDDDENEDLPHIPNKHVNIFLYTAILSFNYEIISKFIVNEKLEYANDILQQACKVGFLKIAQILINQTNTNINIDINKCGKFSALHKACRINDIRLVKFLLTVQGIDINLQSVTHVNDLTGDYNGLTAIEYAIRFGCNKIVELLLSDDRIDVNKKSRWRGWTPIHVAAFYNNVKATKLLLARDDINANAQNHDEYRISQGLTLTAGRETALHLACGKNNIEVVRLMLKSQKVNPVLGNWEDKTPSECTDNQEIKDLFD